MSEAIVCNYKREVQKLLKDGNGISNWETDRPLPLHEEIDKLSLTATIKFSVHMLT